MTPDIKIFFFSPLFDDFRKGGCQGHIKMHGEDVVDKADRDVTKGLLNLFFKLILQFSKTLCEKSISEFFLNNLCLF
ncbi:hypothetical protein ES702_06904 [subsurface metagenome]